MSKHGTITVVTKPSCAQCNALDRAFIKHDIYDLYEVEWIDGTTLSVEELTQMRQIGTQAPVVTSSPVGSFAGFRPDKVEALVAHATEPLAS